MKPEPNKNSEKLGEFNKLFFGLLGQIKRNVLGNEFR